ncbi:hypothetical protein FRC12_013721 [Ceratobasidium sp. 428]|nr:hypothetical protein FRC12_013721 [Ceratobasidium sp. 428]
MSDKEREMWRDHITQGQLDNLLESKRFMFLQPLPGQFDLVWKTTPGRDARVSYLPEGQNYARSLLKISERRVDRLPIAHSGQHYETFQASVEQRLMQYFPNPNNIYVKLLKVGGFYDRAAPAQETEESEGPTYLTLTAEIFFPEAFYKTRSKTKGPPGFAPLIDWCQPNAWLHQPSQTLLGGPFGVKWPVLLVVTLAINCMLIHRAEGPHPPFVDSVKPSFTADQLTTVEKLAWEWVKALGKLYDLLGLSLRDRLAPESAPGLAWLEEWTAEKDLKDVEATGLLPWASEWEEREMAPVGPETGGYRHPKSSRRRESGSSPPKNEPKKRRRAKKKTEVGQDDEGEAQMSLEESQEGSWSAADSEGDGTEETPSDAVRGAGAEEKDELESEDEKDAQLLVEPDPFRRQTRSKSAASGRSAV